MKGILASIIAIVFTVPCYALAGSEEVPLASGMQTKWVGQDIVHNGLKMSIQKFNYSGQPEELIGFYKSVWHAGVQPGLPGFITGSAGGWMVLSRLEQNQLKVIQFKDTGNGIEGFVSVSDIGKVSVREGFDLPRMSGSRLISETESNDSGAKATTFILQNDFSMQSNEEFYRTRLADKGWSLVHSDHVSNNAIMLMNGARGSLEITISYSDRGKSTVFANHVQR